MLLSKCHGQYLDLSPALWLWADHLSSVPGSTGVGREFNSFYLPLFFSLIFLLYCLLLEGRLGFILLAFQLFRCLSYLRIGKAENHFQRATG